MASRSLQKLVFDLNVAPQTAFAALKQFALDEPDEHLLGDATRDAKDKLTGVCFSRKKRGNKKHAEWDNTADAIRKKIETALGEDVRYRASESNRRRKYLPTYGRVAA